MRQLKNKKIPLTVVHKGVTTAYWLLKNHPASCTNILRPIQIKKPQTWRNLNPPEIMAQRHTNTSNASVEARHSVTLQGGHVGGNLNLDQVVTNAIFMTSQPEMSGTGDGQRGRFHRNASLTLQCGRAGWKPTGITVGSRLGW